jgi:two-component system nitrogen regulation response regulator GlnG
VFVGQAAVGQPRQLTEERVHLALLLTQRLFGSLALGNVNPDPPDRQARDAYVAWSAEGKFRPDLYYRLSVFTISLPALRERGDDLPMLIQHFLRRFSRDLGREVQEIVPEALELLRSYSWPGNIRELQGVLKQALLQATGIVLIPAFLPESLRAPPEPAAGKDVEEAQKDFSFEAFILRRLEEGTTALSMEAHQQLDRLLLRLVLQHTGGNQVQAARMLGISRQTLRAKTREFGLSASALANDAADDD